MFRRSLLALFAFGLLSLLHAAPLPEGKEKEEKEEPLQIEGLLLPNDPVDPVHKQPCKVHVVKMRKGRTYVIDMISTDFDSYLRLEDSKGQNLAQDDDGGGNLNSRIRWTPANDDAFLIVATSLGGGQGNYTLKVRPQTALPPLKATPIAFAKGEESIRVQAKLDDNDHPLGPNNAYGKLYSVKLSKGTQYQIDLVRNDNNLDPYLKLQDANGKDLAQDDDGGGNLNSRIRYTPAQDAEFRIVATALGNGQGAFTLTVAKFGVAVPAAKAGPLNFKEGENRLTVSSTLDNTDPAIGPNNGPGKTFTLKMAKGTRYTIDLARNDNGMDPYLKLADPTGNVIAEDDDGGGNLNSRIQYTPKDDGEYKIIATSLNNNGGNFTLSVEKAGAVVRKAKGEAKTHDVPKNGLSINGELTADDDVGAVRQGAFSQTHSVRLKAGKTYTVALESTAFDSFLRIEDSKGNNLAEDDDGGNGSDSLIQFRAPDDGVYRIIATTFSQRQTGQFKLSVSEQ
ncbi:MAG: PPC domain-containing protein [Gemmataceae bacterium]|nr:PPC domain-containing protein [Gemmataceae bacterium]